MLGTINRKSVRQFVHYGIFGISRNAVGYLVYLLITYMGVPPKIATSLMYVVGATVGFIGNRKYIFFHEGSLRGAGIRYLIVHSLGYLINISMFILLVDMLGYPHQWVQVAAIFVVAGFLFITFKYFVFRDMESRE